jgi:hypothetical protein
MRRRSVLYAALLALGCGEEDGMRRGGERFSRGRVANNYIPGPGYDAFSPAGCKNIVFLGDSTTQGVGDVSGQGGYPFRLLNYLIPTYGANKFRFRGTNPIRGYLSSHFTEGHGGYSIEQLTAALDNKPINGNPTGQKMFGLGGYHQNTHLVVVAWGANNMNDYSQTPAQLDAVHRAGLWKLRKQLNETSPSCLIATMGGYLDWGGISQNHDKVLAGNALFPQMILDFNAAFPGQSLISGPNWYDWLGPYDVNNYAAASIVHPNEIGYDRIVTTPAAGPGLLAFLQPTFAALAA